MTAALMAGACKRDRYEGAKKLRFCNISLAASAWMKFTPLEQAKGSIIRLERGIALFQPGETAAAAEAFDNALRDSKARAGSWELGLDQRIVEFDDPGMLALWVSVVKSTE